MIKILHFKVGKGNCCVVETEKFVMAIDLHGNDEKSAYELVSPFFRKEGKKNCLDVLVVTHGDKDHCGGYNKFQEEIDAGNLIIGKIIHQDYNRIENDDDDWSDDYECLQDEIDRREKIEDAKFGDLVYAPKNGDDVSIVMDGVFYPDDLEFDVLSPYEGDNENTEYDVNDLSLVFRLNFPELESMLFTGDSSYKYWIDQIKPNLNDEDAKSKYLIVSHHGSFTFFGKDRDEVRNADPYPDNYDALDKIEPEELIISASDKFPLNGDSKRDQPPHYAAYEWYHKWFRDNRSVKEKESHPKSWHYTSEGHICFEWDGVKWDLDENWTIEKEQAKNVKKLGEKHKEGELKAPGFIIPKTNYYAE